MEGLGEKSTEVGANPTEAEVGIILPRVLEPLGLVSLPPLGKAVWQGQLVAGTQDSFEI